MLLRPPTPPRERRRLQPVKTPSPAHAPTAGAYFD